MEDNSEGRHRQRGSAGFILWNFGGLERRHFNRKLPRAESALPQGVRNRWWLEKAPWGWRNHRECPERVGGSINWAVTLGRQFPLFQ